MNCLQLYIYEMLISEKLMTERNFDLKTNWKLKYLLKVVLFSLFKEGLFDSNHHIKVICKTGKNLKMWYSIGFRWMKATLTIPPQGNSLRPSMKFIPSAGQQFQTQETIS